MSNLNIDELIKQLNEFTKIDLRATVVLCSEAVSQSLLMQSEKITHLPPLGVTVIGTIEIPSEYGYGFFFETEADARDFEKALRICRLEKVQFQKAVDSIRTLFSHKVGGK